MSPQRRRNLLGGLVVASIMVCATACESYFWLPGFDKGGTPSTPSSGLPILGDPFTENLIQERTFTHGTSVTTVTYAVDDRQRLPLAADFNSDGKLDPVVGYGDDQAVIQILLSRSGSGVDPLSLTLDSKRDMQNLADVAVGDIDDDGYLDIVAAADAAVWYFHHPPSGEPTDLRNWGNADPNDPLRERIDASYQPVTQEELAAVVAQAVGPTINLDYYYITIVQLYTNVEIADFDNDGDNDIVASRYFVATLTPRVDAPVEELQITDGDVMILVNPGSAVDGHNWLQVSIGKHERQSRLDRDGASGLLVRDVDGDGWLDVVSSAREDNNAQIAWFRNPASVPLATENTWTQYRIGSIRDSWALDVGDVTGDGWPDVIATGAAQMQTMLFEHPGVAFPNDRYDYDWDTHVIATFQSYEPRDAKLLDMDNDTELELVVGGSNGAVRYFEPPINPRQEWTGQIIITFDDGGDVSLLGYGDLDGDNDLDLVATIGATEDNQSRIVWIRNNLVP